MFSSTRPFYRDMERAYAAGADVLATRGMVGSEKAKDTMQVENDQKV